MNRLKKVGLIVGVVFLAYFGMAAFTYPTGVAAAVTDPWEAITLLTERITQLEWRVARIEDILGLNRGSRPGKEQMVVFDETKYPYLAEIAPELEGKIAARYRYQIVSLGPKEGYPPIPGKWLIISTIVKNLADQPITGISYDYTVRHLKSDFKDSGGIISYGSKDKEDWLLPGKVREIEDKIGLFRFQPNIADPAEFEVKVIIQEILFPD